MSEPWTPEERARRLGLNVPKRASEMDTLGKVIGCVAGLVFIVLMLAAMGAIVVKLWRMAVA